MNRNTFRYPFVVLVVVLLMALLTVQLVAGQETGDEVEIVGTVVSIDEATGSFTVETESGETYTVFPGEDFDFSTLQVGDTVEVEGILNEDGSIAADKVKVEAPEDEDDPDDEQEGPASGFFCRQSDVQHPFGAMLAARYETDYETLQDWFCEGFGWGQIMLALQTEKRTGNDPAALLEARSSGAGWGVIWQDLKLIGRPDFAGPPEGRDGGKPDFAGPPDDRGGGKPDFAGPPEDKDGGKPDFAGPPANRP